MKLTHFLVTFVGMMVVLNAMWCDALECHTVSIKNGKTTIYGAATENCSAGNVCFHKRILATGECFFLNNITYFMQKK